MDTAENTALSHQNDLADKMFSYYNAKEMLEPGDPFPPIPTPAPDMDKDIGEPLIYVQPKVVVLEKRPEFHNTPVNFSVSSVHVPVNVFDRGLNPLMIFIIIIRVSLLSALHLYLSMTLSNSLSLFYYM